MKLPLLLPSLLDISFTQTSSPTPAEVTGPCPFLGQIYPPPTSIASSKIWEDATANIKKTIINSKFLDQDKTSYAIQIVSLHESEPLFELYHKAPRHRYGKEGSAEVDGDTVFRIASTSKLYAVYALLLNCGFRCFGDPITKYIPELADGYVVDRVNQIDWEDVTLGALASHLAGLGSEYALGDHALEPKLEPGPLFGLPDAFDLGPNEVPSCGGGPDQRACTREESIESVLRHGPVFPTFYTPSYSNIAFQLLGFAVENITGKALGQAMDDSIFKPLGLKHTTTTCPSNHESAIFIPGDGYFCWDGEVDIATGGVYASANDMTKFALSILNHTQLSASQTRRWMKPWTHTADPEMSMGVPWEILRRPGLSKYHTVEIYSKGGSLPPYTTEFGMIPDLGVAYVVNMLSEDGDSAYSLVQDVLPFLTPLHQIAKAQAMERFAGTYIDERPGVESRFTIISDDQIGLFISEWVNDGADILSLLKRLGGEVPRPALFPTTLSSKSACGNERVAFRAILQDFSGGSCDSWVTADTERYAGIGLDLIVFETAGGDDGNAYAVQLPALRTRYRRVTGSGLRSQS